MKSRQVRVDVDRSHLEAALADDHDSTRVVEPQVLQPIALLGQDGSAFQAELVAALNQSQAVIVDLLRIETIGPEVMKVLLAAMQQAHACGTSLSFLSMDAGTQKQLDAMWVARHNQKNGDRQDWFAPEFENFLVDNSRQQHRNLNILEIASKTRW
jgi:anti-anti-sigma regulatory factor